MRINFTKMQGIGNDYIYINCIGDAALEGRAAAVVPQLSRRRFGVGSDGVILICGSEIADIKMRVFNADGSEARMCGNGIRCVAKYVWDNGICVGKSLAVETLSGVKHVEKVGENYKVQMGRAVVSVEDVDMGNPHKVFFHDDIEGLDIKLLASPYPDVNVEFAKIINRHTIKMRVWERGSGETLACGTGACAVVAAATAQGFFDRGKPVTVQLRGGELVIQIVNGEVFMTGPAETVYEGEINDQGKDKRELSETAE